MNYRERACNYRRIPELLQWDVLLENFLLHILTHAPSPPKNQQSVNGTIANKCLKRKQEIKKLTLFWASLSFNYIYYHRFHTSLQFSLTLTDFVFTSIVRGWSSKDKRVLLTLPIWTPISHTLLTTGTEQITLSPRVNKNGNTNQDLGRRTEPLNMISLLQIK